VNAPLLTPRPGTDPGKLGVVLSGGGSRTAYQVGALRAISKVISEERDKIGVIVGSSIGAVNTVILSGCLHAGLDAAISALTALWKNRTYRNTFEGSPTRAFLRTIQVAVLRYSSPSPVATSLAIFNPSPLRKDVDNVILEFGGTVPTKDWEGCTAGVMTTVEGKERKPLLFVAGPEKIPERQLLGANFGISYVQRLTAAHGFASAALPSVLPPVDLSAEAGEVRLVDGGICDNLPVDPAVRLGAERLITIDASGRRWWFDHYEEPHYTRPTWEVAASEQTFCMCPRASFEVINNFGLGEVLRQTVGRSSKDFIAALGPTWPVFRILKHKMGEKLAYEVMSYVALHPGYFEALLQIGYEETLTKLKNGFSAGLSEAKKFQELRPAL